MAGNDRPAIPGQRLPGQPQHLQIFQGPIPPAEELAKYEAVLHGAADRILKMAEGQSSHRQWIERRVIVGDFIKGMTGTVLAYITFGGSMYGAVYLLLHDKPIESLAAFIAAIGAAFGPKIYADFTKPPAPSQS
jgi:predicted membrane protein DUF2335